MQNDNSSKTDNPQKIPRSNIRYFTSRPTRTTRSNLCTKKKCKNINTEMVWAQSRQKTYIGHRHHWNTIILTLNADNNQTSDRIKETNPPQRFTVNTDSLTNTAKPTESQINIYTDGSLTDEHAGSGYTIQYKKRELIADSIRLPMHTTVFQAEIIAINEACKKFIDTKQSNMQYIKIFSDSQAAILALNSNTITSSLSLIHI